MGLDATSGTALGPITRVASSPLIRALRSHSYSVYVFVCLSVCVRLSAYLIVPLSVLVAHL